MPAVDKFIDGYKRFKSGYYEENKHKLRKLADEGQSPKVLIVGCSDSRVDPSTIFDCDPGDFFVIRNVANLVPPCESAENSYHGTSAALEYAVTVLEVESIIILGHTQCGGIKALMDTPPTEEAKTFISKWIQQLSTVRDEVLESCDCEDIDCKHGDRYHVCEEKGILKSLDNLMTFPWVKERVEAGTLYLHGWHYDLGDGFLYAKCKDSDEFEKVG